MKTMTRKEPITIEYYTDPFTGEFKEKKVFVILNKETGEYTVSRSPQTILGYSPIHEMVYAGPYSQWIRPMTDEERQRAGER